MLLIVLAIGVPVISRAQVGSGWTEVHPNKSLQLRGAGAFHLDSGVEVFSITNALRSGDHRAEQRVWNDYQSGTHQFEGYLKVVSLDGTFINLKQTFESGTAAWFLLTVDPGAHGTLRDHSRGTLLATNVIGRLVRVNTIHDMTMRQFYVYIDGVLKETRTDGTGMAYNDKYGTYRAISGGGPVVAEWSKVRFWTGGSTNEAVAPKVTDGKSAE